MDLVDVGGDKMRRLPQGERGDRLVSVVIGRTRSKLVPSADYHRFTACLHERGRCILVHNFPQEKRVSWNRVVSR
jgi:hypothetical protein